MNIVADSMKQMRLAQTGRPINEKWVRTAVRIAGKCSLRYRFSGLECQFVARPVDKCVKRKLTVDIYLVLKLLGHLFPLACRFKQIAWMHGFFALFTDFILNIWKVCMLEIATGNLVQKIRSRSRWCFRERSRRRLRNRSLGLRSRCYRRHNRLWERFRKRSCRCRSGRSRRFLSLHYHLQTNGRSHQRRNDFRQLLFINRLKPS